MALNAGTATPLTLFDKIELGVRFSLIALGAGILIFSAAQVAAVDRPTNTSTADHNTTVTQNPTPANGMTTTVIESKVHATTANAPDARLSEATLGTLAGLGALLVIAGGYYNRKFEFGGPGGFSLKSDWVQMIHASAMAKVKANDATAHLATNPDAMNAIVAEAIHAYQPPRPFRVVPLSSFGAKSASDFDAVIDQAIQKVAASPRYEKDQT